MYHIYLKDVEEFISKRMASGPIVESNYISSTLKNRRLELSMTLSEVTKDICSEAFLSKVERNLMDGKNERIAMLCERLDLDYQRLMDIEEGSRIMDLLNSYFEENYETIYSMENELNQTFFVAQDKIVYAYICFLKEDYRSFHEAILELDAVKECLCDIELFALFLIMIDYYTRILELMEAKTYLGYIKKLEIDNDIVTMMILERDFILSSKLEDERVEETYVRLKSFYEHGYPIRKQFLMMIYYLKTKKEERSLKTLEEIKKNYFPQPYEYSFYYCKMYLLTELERYSEVLESIEQETYKTFEIFCLYAYSLLHYMEHLDDKTLETKKKKLEGWMTTTKHKGIDGFHHAFLRLLMYEIEKMDDQFICNYLKNYLIKEFQMFSCPLYQRHYTQLYCELLGHLSRYKDAYLFLLSHKKALKKSKI